MAIKIKKNVTTINEVEVENPIVAEYLSGIPEKERIEAFSRALGIGILAEIKGEIAHFLHDTESELGNRLASLKTLYELRELRFKETSAKGAAAEKQVIQALADIQSAANFSSDEISDLSLQRGAIRNNKTGDILIAVDGENDRTIGLEIKLDKKVSLGSLNNRNPDARTDTAIGQLIEMRANRATDANIIVFDEDNVDPTVSKATTNGVGYIQAIGFIVIVSTRRGDFTNLAIVYSVCREMVKANLYEKAYDGRILSMIIERLLYLLNSYQSFDKEITKINNNADAIKKSASGLEEKLEATSQFISSTESYLKSFLTTGELSEAQLHDFYTGRQLEIIDGTDND